MKKGLLTLLAAALTIVGCQDYDSQFKELTTLVTNLATDVAGLQTVSNDIATLSQTVAGLATALDVAAIQADIDLIEAALAEVATDADLTAVSDALALVQADVKELLAASAVINQSITISNEATLQYAESLVATSTDAPNVIVNGSVTVVSTFANADASLTSRINAVTAKIATILGVEGGAGLALTHSASSVINFNNLAFIDKTMEISGGAFGHDTLTTISGNVTETHTGAIDYPLLASAGAFVVGTDHTSVNFPTTANITSISTTGSATGELWLKKATSVVTGKALVSGLTAPKATAITIGTGAAQAGNATISTALNAVINLTSTSLAGNLSVTGGASQTTFFGSSLTYVGGTTTVGDYAEAHFPKVTQFGGNTTLGAAVLDLTALTSNVSGTLVFSRALTVDTQKLVVSSNVTYTAATTAHFASTNQASMTLPAVTTLKVFKQGVKTDLDVSGYATMTSFTIGGAQGAAPFISSVINTIDIGGAALATVNILDGDYDIVDIDGAAVLTSLTTAGEIRDFTINNCDALVSATIGHDHISGSDASDIAITGNLKLASFAPSALKFVGNIDISTNAALASIDLSSITKIPLAGDYTVAIDGNKLTGSYVAATAGSTTTVSSEAEVKSNDLFSMMAMVDLAIASRASATIGNVTYTFDVDVDDIDSATAGAQDLDTKINNPAIAGSIAAAGIGSDVNFKAIVKAE